MLRLLIGRHFVKRFAFLLGYFALAIRVCAHEPFDLSSRMVLHEHDIELRLTMGPDVVRELLGNADYSAAEIKRSLITLGPENRVFHSPSLAGRLFEIHNATTTIVATGVSSLSEGLEVIFILNYPRPSAGRLKVHAVCYETIGVLKSGVFVVEDEVAGQLAGRLLSKESSRLSFTLPPATPAISAPALGGTPPALDSSNAPENGPASEHVMPEPALSFKAFFKLGVEHILAGIDHLLFLTALLLGVRKLTGMLGVITYFTVAHSVTLALAALNVVTFPSRVIEPLIALSIIVVGCDNLFRQRPDRDRWRLASGFGLIHGFGFASALRETGLAGVGHSIVVPLVSFNLGVETGQLMVAAILLPILILARGWGTWRSYGTPLVTSCVLAVSFYWLVQRIFSAQ